MMADDQDNNVRIEHLFSVAICIIVYFIIVQTLKGKGKNSKPISPLNENGSSVFMSAIETLFDIELEKKKLWLEQQHTSSLK